MKPAADTHSRRAFTLLELLVACAILTLILAVMLSMITQTSNAWRSLSARIETFQSARLGFENLTRLLEQATLNTYWDYDDPNDPKEYKRKSELHFLVGTSGTMGMPGTPTTGQAVFFQAPANVTGTTTYEGLGGLINGCGFFIQFGSDAAWLPVHVNAAQARERFRLMQWMEDTEKLKVYETADASWIPDTVANLAAPVADNVIALVIWPKEEGTPTSPVLDSYAYDSRADLRPSALAQMPPMLQVAMVAIDETSADRLGSALQSTIEECMGGLFVDHPAQDFTQDIQTLQTRLNLKSITNRSFVSAVPMREAKWSP